MESFFDNESFEDEIKKHKELMASQKYQQEKKYFDKLIDDFLKVITVSKIYSSRDWKLYQNSLLINNADQFIESAISIAILVREGAINPTYRELRYMLETAVKYLIVDQKKTDLNYENKIKYFTEKIPRSSINCVENIKIIGLDTLDTKEFINNIKDVYKKLSKYTHPSKTQIDVKADREKRGAYLGLESEKDLKSINNFVNKVFEFIIAIYITNLGLALAGDIFTCVLDTEKGWKFYKSKYIKKISNIYNYKLERKSKHD
ncbi:hypothetical protein [Clostridium perfringens]|uniref:hypothetical protein n=1 Tax=Clostridium perfringens TaxID=1502 RepID=UPI003218DFAE